MIFGRISPTSLAADEILSFVSGLDFHNYESNILIQRAVERDFEIIGEALERIRKIDNTFIQQTTDFEIIIGFRNILIHGYDTVDESIVWNAIKNHLPLLVQEVTSRLNRE